MNPLSKLSSSSNPELGKSRQAAAVATAAALVVLPALAILGGDAFQKFIDFGAGVLALLCLSGAVVWGLIASDRLFLSPRDRLISQAIHRTTAVGSLVFLLLHISIKVFLGKVALIGALIPFSLGVTGTGALIGLGSFAALMMVVAALTGAARSVFVPTPRYAGRWRAIHMVAYPAWCAGLVHGLFAGRPAASWVTWLYGLTMLGVAAALSLRLLPAPTKRRVADVILAITGGSGSAPPMANEESARRNLVSSPLPGSGGLLPGSGGIPSQRAARDRQETASAREAAFSTQSMGSVSGSGRGTPRIAAPNPPLYEATRAPVDPTADTFIASRADVLPGLGPDPLQDTGTNLSAGYRAVSGQGQDSRGMTAPMPATGPLGGPPSGEIPLAERIPMTEELPIITDDPLGKGGSWPTPSPPQPAQAFVTPPAAPAYDTGTVPAYGSGGVPAYDTGQTPQYDAGAGVGAYDTGAIPAYDPNTAAYGQNASPPYGAGPAPAYDTGAVPTYGSGPVPPYDTGAVPAYDGQAYQAQTPAPQAPPASPAPSVGAEPPLGPLYQPRGGEPWNASAGDRP
ncbi:hypothetical protein ACWEJP_20125 [Streptomyces sp. NPDC004749]